MQAVETVTNDTATSVDMERLHKGVGSLVSDYNAAMARALVYIGDRNGLFTAMAGGESVDGRRAGGQDRPASAIYQGVARRHNALGLRGVRGGDRAIEGMASVGSPPEDIPASNRRGPAGRACGGCRERTTIRRSSVPTALSAAQAPLRRRPAPRHACCDRGLGRGCACRRGPRR